MWLVMRMHLLNLPINLYIPESHNFGKMHMRGLCFVSSPVVINDFLGRGRIIYANSLSSMKTIVYVMSRDDKNVWRKNGLLPSPFLGAKYPVLNRIEIAKWAPSSYGSGVTQSLVYQTGTRVALDFGKSIIYHVLECVECYAFKLPIGSPSLITGILVPKKRDFFVVMMMLLVRFPKS